MDLSIVIVSYNVKYYLENCLLSVFKASENLAVEIFVVDNNSHDGTQEYILSKFQNRIKYIQLDQNLGFSKANNVAIRQAKGKYTLLLNPDTVIAEDTLTQLKTYMDEHPETGAAGVKMIDGNGNFLPESKRGLPKPWVAFYKIFGISSLFPKSKKFGKYHLTYLDKNQIHYVDVLSGAFMFIRTDLLQKIGGLDEDYFMYGEDIDLSYQITQKGYKNVYYPHTTIIHYKGESTKKETFKYVMVFYKAMIIFARKNFSKSLAFWYNIIIRLAIYLRATAALFKRLYNRIALPLLDILFISAGSVLFIYTYSSYRQILYDYTTVAKVISLFLTAYLFIHHIGGSFDKPFSNNRLLKSSAITLIAVMTAYSLLPETLRFSRAYALFFSIFQLIYIFSCRWLGLIINPAKFTFEDVKKQKYFIVANKENQHLITRLLEENQLNIQQIFPVSAAPVKMSNEQFIGDLQKLEEAIKIFHPQNIIYSAEDMSYKKIIHFFERLATENLNNFIFHSYHYAISNDTILTFDKSYIRQINSNINKKIYYRQKRMFDVLFSFLYLLLFPLFYLRLQVPIKEIGKVIIGKKTWLGKCSDNISSYYYVQIPKGIFCLKDYFKDELKYYFEYNVFFDIKFTLRLLTQNKNRLFFH